MRYFLKKYQDNKDLDQQGLTEFNSPNPWSKSLTCLGIIILFFLIISYLIMRQQKYTLIEKK